MKLGDEKRDYASQVAGNDYGLTQGNEEPKGRDEQWRDRSVRKTRTPARRRRTRRVVEVRERDQSSNREREINNSRASEVAPFTLGVGEPQTTEPETNSNIFN